MVKRNVAVRQSLKPQKLYMVAVRLSGPAAIPRSESSLVKIYGDGTDIIIDRPTK